MFYIEKLKITNFRCYSSFFLEFKKGNNIIIGPNACGKTSIVEAIQYLCIIKSFRTSKEKELVKNNESFLNITGEIHISDEKTNKVSIGYDMINKKIVENNKVYPLISDYVGKYRVVSFTPDDLDIIKGYPIIRRHYFDVFISQINNDYLKTLTRLKKILKQRNEYLKDCTIENLNVDLMDAIDEVYAKEATKLIEYRTFYVNEIIDYVKNELLFISDGKEKIDLIYQKSVKTEDFLNVIKKNRKTDVFLHSTTIGPHKDDYEIRINDKLASSYGSQGQIRSCIIAIKLGMASYFKTKSDNLVIILDDVLSELDFKRQEKLLFRVQRYNQVFITTTDLTSIPKNTIENSNIINLKDGEKNE